jgi:hypothetical protein
VNFGSIIDVSEADCFLQQCGYNRSMLAWYLFLAVLVFAWARIELRHTATSRGITSTMLGCLLFGFGLIGATSFDKVYSWLAIAVGTFMALYGLARFAAVQRC